MFDYVVTCVQKAERIRSPVVALALARTMSSDADGLPAQVARLSAHERIVPMAVVFGEGQVVFLDDVFRGNVGGTFPSR